MFLVLGCILAVFTTGSCSGSCGKEVYFQAHLTYGSKPGTHRTVIFDVVDFQKGGGYNSTSGEFHAPVSGLYQFMVYVVSTERGSSSYSLTHQRKLLQYAKIHSANSPASFTTIVKVKKGDIVEVWKSWGDCYYPKMSMDSQFVGYLLRAD